MSETQSFKCRYIARFTPEAWVNGQAIEVDPQGVQEWDVTADVEANPDYWRLMNGEEMAHDPRLTTEDEWREGVLDRHDRLRDDPHAPEWVRKWTGPFTIRVRMTTGEETS